MTARTDPPETGDKHADAAPEPLRLQILGPLRAWRHGDELDIGPRQQAYLLSLLLARVGSPVSTAELVDLIWDDAPPSALNVIHKYVGALRRLLEPEVPPRATGSLLVRRGNGYLFTATAATLDLVGFRELVVRAGNALGAAHRDAALADYVEALDLWSGPAGAGLDHGSNAAAVFAGLNNEFFDACAAAAKLAVSLGRPEPVIAPLHLAATMGPLHEPVLAGLISSLGAAGRQGEALSVYRAVRARLADDLGVDPGRALEAAHSQVLSQGSSASGAAFSVPPPAEADRRTHFPRLRGLVGRAEESAALQRTVAQAVAGHSGVTIVEGEPGAGKTRLLQEVTAAATREALVVWGNSLEGEGAPSMWPWVQVVESLLGALPVPAQESWLASDLGRLVVPREGVLAGSVLPDSGTQFRLFEGVVGVVAHAATHRPVVMVLDDLHWADVTSLKMLAHLAGKIPTGTAIIGALRDRAPTPGTELARMLAAVSRVPGHRRIRLGPLGRPDVVELVRRETGREPGPDVVRNILDRTSGNAFFVRELARFLADNDALDTPAAARAGVPSTVRDVVRDRLAHLDETTAELLLTAALIGRDVGVELLTDACGSDVADTLDRLDTLGSLGLLEPAPQDPFSFRFAHDLLRESVVGTMPPRRATRLHMRIADALERRNSGDESVAERLAYHLWSAGPLVDPSRTAGALVRAGSCAATKSALEAAERHLRTAVEISRRAGLTELELAALSQLTAVVGMRSMYGAAVDLLARAEHLARTLGRELEATGFLYSRWAAHAQGIELERSGPLARRLLELGYASTDPIVRAYGLQAWGIHEWDVGNIGEAYRYLSQSERTLLANLARHDEDPVRRDLKLLMTGLLAEVTALHGDVEAARALLDTLESAAGDNPYRITVWATMVTRIAAIVGDPAWALTAAARGIAADPGFSFVFLGTYQRLARCWALTVTGRGSATTISEARRLIAANLLDPPRSCVATWYGLLGEMHLVTGSIDAAAQALDRADFYLETYGQRYPEGLLLLLRARLLHARGEPLGVVRAAAENARRISIDHEARLFARRADQFLTALA